MRAHRGEGIGGGGCRHAPGGVAILRSLSVPFAMLLLVFAPLLPLGAAADIYTIGSSFTWDGRPPDLDDAPQWHIECGRSLIYIHDNPSNPCVTSSVPWPTALSTTLFDAISFQPVPGPESTLWDDVFSIYDWVRNQPGAKLVIHQTWPVPSEWEAVLHGPGDATLTNRSLAYGYLLLDWLKVVFPDHEIVLTRSNEMMDRIYHDCLTGCPLAGGFATLFRDASGHMSVKGGYIQHNALRAAFGQPTGVQSPLPEGQVAPDVKAYLDEVVTEYLPEPGVGISSASGALLLAGLARTRRRRGSGR